MLNKQKTEIDEKRKYALEMGSSEEKIKQMEAMIQEAEFEFKDRTDRLNKVKAEFHNNYLFL